VLHNGLASQPTVKILIAASVCEASGSALECTHRQAVGVGMAKRKPGIVPRVFLSHSSRDQWIAERSNEKLEEVGAEVWLDAFDLSGGRNVKERIKEGMRSSTECLILLSAASRDSDWVKHEAGLADAYGIPTAIVLLHVSDDNVPDPLRDQKYFDMNEFPAYVRHLAALVRMK
jgi:hypothetical protein